MKISSLLLLPLLFSAVAANAGVPIDAKNILGTYEITLRDVPGVKNTITLSVGNKIELVEEAMGNRQKCIGTYELDLRKQLLKSEVSCENGRMFTQILNVSGDRPRFRDPPWARPTG